MEAYLTLRGKRDLFNDVEYFDACRRLSLIVGEREITVLLAKLYAERMIATKEGVSDGTLPENIPDLMLSYVNEVNRGVETNRLDDCTVQHIANTIAWECLKKTFRPTPAKRDDVLTALVGESHPEALLMYLEDRLRLIQTSGAGRNNIRFALDPLAEYLAGLHVAGQYGEREDWWQEFFAQADAVEGSPETIKGFLLAVRDCCAARSSEVKVPGFVPAELVKRTEGDRYIPI